MTEPVDQHAPRNGTLEDKDQRIQALERRLYEAETNLQALISQQIDAVLTSSNTMPLLLRQAQQALQRSNEALEQRVAQRTAELNQANTTLKRELEERKRVEAQLRKSEAKLRESEAKFHSAFEHAAIGFAMTTPAGRFIDANPAFCALTGYTIDELQAFAFDLLLYPDDYAENMGLNEQMSAGKIPGFVIENRYVRKDGQVVWVRKSISQVRDPDGVAKWNIALVEDITERKVAEQKLEQAHNELVGERSRLLAVMEALPVGLAIYDEKGG